MQQVTMRPATGDDLPEIVRMLADDEKGRVRERYWADAPPARCYQEAIEAIEANPDNLLIVAETGGNIVGTFQLIYIPSISFQGGVRAQIESVRVDKSLRGAGIGTQMMEWAVEQARARGCHLVQLTTHRDRDDAHRFYERLGFAKTHVGMKLSLS